MDFLSIEDVRLQRGSAKPMEALVTMTARWILVSQLTTRGSDIILAEGGNAPMK